MKETKQKFIIDDGEILGVDGENHFKERWFSFNGIDLKVLVTKAPLDSNKEGYFNFYIISQMFKQDVSNCLDIQEPYNIIEKMPEEELLRFMEERAISFYLWYKYNRSYSIDSEEIPL